MSGSRSRVPILSSRPWTSTSPAFWSMMNGLLKLPLCPSADNLSFSRHPIFWSYRSQSSSAVFCRIPNTSPPPTVVCEASHVRYTFAQACRYEPLFLFFMRIATTTATMTSNPTAPPVAPAIIPILDLLSSFSWFGDCPSSRCVDCGWYSEP